jgi:hypothetical protein
MKANVKFWPESKSLDVSLYAETETELTQLRMFQEQVSRVGGVNLRTGLPAYVPFPFRFDVKVPATECNGTEAAMKLEGIQGRARLADVPLTGAWPKARRAL